MARSGSRSDWERRLIAQRQEYEERAKARQARNKERGQDPEQEHRDSQQRTADEQTAAVCKQVTALDEVLTAALKRPALSFERMMVVPEMPPFDPGPQGQASPPPQWHDFAPPPPQGLGRLLHGPRHRSLTARARKRFDVAQAEHGQQMSQQGKALASARAEYDQAHTQHRAKAAERNAYLASRQSAVAAGDPESVEWFVGCVLRASRYPDGFPREFRVAYRPENRDVVAELELPAPGVVPSVRGYRYLATTDVIEPLTRPDGEVGQRYERLICCVALRTLHELFAALPRDMVQAVLYNGRVGSTDPATGKPTRPHLLSVSVERPEFEDLVLAAVDPAACLARLNALVSPDPRGLAPVAPFLTFDLGKFRFGQDQPGLSFRPNLLRLSAADFEKLLRRLFLSLGARSWTVLASKDGGLDAVLDGDDADRADGGAGAGADPALDGLDGLDGIDALDGAACSAAISRGPCLVQARRRTGQVDTGPVQALADAMAHRQASRGVLITTSWFSRGAERLARRRQITLLNGAELRQLIKQHLDTDVDPGGGPSRLHRK